MYGWDTWSASSLWSLALIAFTIMIHAIGIVFIAIGLERFCLGTVRRRYTILENSVRVAALITVVALSLVVLHALECTAWAMVYVHLNAMSSSRDALLYSVDSMTTRGASDLTLGREWRMMGAWEAGDGMLLFGISTAFLFYVMQRLLQLLQKDETKV